MGATQEAARRRALERLPDTLEGFHARALLTSGRGSVAGDPDTGFVVVDELSSLAVPCFRPARELAALPARRPRFGEAVAPLADAAFLREALPDWTHREALLYVRRSDAVDDDEDRDERGAVMLEPGREDALAGLPAEWGASVRRAWERGPVAAVLADGRAVSVCSSFCESERLWDVSIDTLEAHRRRGYARRATARLIRHQRERGRAPVWGTTEDNLASRALAESLGFRECGRLATAEAPE